MTITPLVWTALAGPLALLAVALLPAGNPKALAANARTAALISLATALAGAIGIALNGPASAALPGISILFDGLTAVMFLLVSFVGSIVVHFSRNYMAGDPGHARFTRLLSVTLASVLLLILSGNMAIFFLAWVATSVGLNQLLLFYGDRQAAILAARKKFIASRIGDLALAAAIYTLWTATGSLEFTGVFAALKAQAAAGADTAPTLILAGVAIAVAALLKSAQFPLHGWITEVMETPTPVSALLHAGIINAGGFLALRFSPLLELSIPAMDLLLVVGGFTALFASVVMLTQNAIKVSLAWSTIAQMGFMLLQCGLGAWPAALLHIVAHSLYKAHAFLSSGSVIDIARASWSPSPGGAPHPARLAMAVALVLAAVGVTGTLSGFEVGTQPGVFALGAILLMGLTHYIAQSIDQRPTGFVIARTVVGALAVATGWFALQAGMAALMAGTLPSETARTDALALAAISVIVAGFAALTIGQASFITTKGGATPAWARAFYIHVQNGLYVNTIANRLVLALWPTGLPARR
jgi:NAD(P)H-quinone oxidoreductase subunit 5